jgi:hypothetical protein
MFDHLIFANYAFLFLFSTIGYGVFFSKIFNLNLLELNFGWYGLIGLFSLSLISILSSFIFAHGYFHNSIIHILGIIFFIYLKLKNNNNEKILGLIILLIILYIGLFIFKTHDDFPYYHLTYSLNLSENSFMVGTGNFGHGFRTFSSIFFYNSILYLPKIDYYFYNGGQFLVLFFFDYIVLKKLHDYLKKKNFNFSFFYSLLSFIFINIAFYRLSEHGTDRSAQILLLLIFLLFIEIFYFNIDQKSTDLKISLLLILVSLASSMKAIYYLYLILLPIIFFKKKMAGYFFKKKKLILIFFVMISLFFNFLVGYLSTGCFLYPEKKTCFFDKKWSISEKEVDRMSIHYEWWAKGGGGPNYSHKLDKSIYVQNFNWVDNWIKKHFFNKVSDTLFGLIIICLIVGIVFFFNKKNVNLKSKKINNLIYFIVGIFFLEWFFKHPAMRYGGYVLFALPLIIFTASILSRLRYIKKNIYYVTIGFVIFTLATYNIRNINRLSKEIKLYGYNLKSSPFFFVESISTSIVSENDELTIYSPGKAMCWASKTPCSNRKDILIGKYLWMNMIYKKN